MALNLIVDFDSTIVKVEALDELAKIIALRSRDDTVPGKVRQITEMGMRGEISFSESLKQRLQILNFHRSDLDLLINLLNHNITETFKDNVDAIRSKADRFIIVSGGFEDFIIPVTSKLSIDASSVFANKFIFDSTGRLVGIDEDRPLAKDRGKVEIVRELGLQGETIVVGDGITDFEIKKEGLADLFIAFTGNIRREEVMQKADHKIQNFEELVHILNSI